MSAAAPRGTTTREKKGWRQSARRRTAVRGRGGGGEHNAPLRRIRRLRACDRMGGRGRPLPCLPETGANARPLPVRGGDRRRKHKKPVSPIRSADAAAYFPRPFPNCQVASHELRYRKHAVWRTSTCRVTNTRTRHTHTHTHKMASVGQQLDYTIQHNDRHGDHESGYGRHAHSVWP